MDEKPKLRAHSVGDFCNFKITYKKHTALISDDHDLNEVVGEYSFDILALEPEIEVEEELRGITKSFLETFDLATHIPK